MFSGCKSAVKHFVTLFIVFRTFRLELVVSKMLSRLHKYGAKTG